MVITDYRALYLPYCLERQPDGTWIVLNRNYKPVGMVGDGFVDYETHPSRVTMEGLNRSIARKLSERDLEDGPLKRIYLYDDGSSPMNDEPSMQAYLEKLAVLAKLKIEIR